MLKLSHLAIKYITASVPVQSPQHAGYLRVLSVYAFLVAVTVD